MLKTSSVFGSQFSIQRTTKTGSSLTFSAASCGVPQGRLIFSWYVSQDSGIGAIPEKRGAVKARREKNGT